MFFWDTVYNFYVAYHAYLALFELCNFSRC